ncbi:c-type cytochrome, partial [bacterium]|nr:c-type cytochrome [bacterium]
ELRRVLSEYPESIRRMIPAASSDQTDQARLAKLQSLSHLLENGSATAGRKVFQTGRIACTTCHAIDGKGGQVGPDLSRIGAIRSNRDLLEAVVYPSASFARGYRSYSVVTDAGRIHTGLIERQTKAEIVLKTRDLKQIRIPTSEIGDLVESSVSIMPKGLETVLSEQELRDLLAYLSSLK